MTLSAEQFAAVVESIQADAPAGRLNKRRAGRVVYRCRAPIIAGFNTSAARPMVVTVRDLSPRGVGVLSDQPISRGTQFVLQLSRANQPGVRLLCTVIHSRQREKGLWSLGAEFTCMLPARSPRSAADSRADLERIRKSMLA